VRILSVFLFVESFAKQPFKSPFPLFMTSALV
jgi:hypothetical protein